MFWGAVVVVVDLEINGFDLINDSVGTAAICWGLWTLGREPGSGGCQRALRGVTCVQVIVLIWTVVEQLDPEASDSSWSLAVQFLQTAGWVAFMAIMASWCAYHGLHRSTGKWRTALLLAIVIWGSIEAVGVVLAATADPPVLLDVVRGHESTAFVVVVAVAVIGMLPAAYAGFSLVVTRRDLDRQGLRDPRQGDSSPAQGPYAFDWPLSGS